MPAWLVYETILWFFLFYFAMSVTNLHVVRALLVLQAFKIETGDHKKKKNPTFYFLLFAICILLYLCSMYILSAMEFQTLVRTRANP